jgi:protein TonB
VAHEVPPHRQTKAVERRPQQIKPSGTAQAQKSTSGVRGSRPGGASVASLEAAYLAELRQPIARRRSYPRIARQQGLTGRTIISFVLQADGRIMNAHLASASGHEVLDEAALSTVRRLGQFKPIPAATGRSHWPLRIPLDFSLN